MARAFSVEDGGLSKHTTVRTTRNREYVDLDLAFAAKGSGDVYKKTAVASVNQALKVLLLTNRTEKPFSPYFGANLNTYLFELADKKTVSDIERAIKENIRVFEPRIDFSSVRVFTDLDDNNNQLTITIIYTIVNTNKQVEFTTRLNRLR